MEISNINLKLIPNFNGYYAGDDGFIYSSWKKNKIDNYKRKKLKGNLSSNKKYYQLYIKNNNDIYINTLVHRLVCITFNGTPLNENFVCSHLNGNSFNNIPTNLIWETQKNNLLRRKDHGTDDIGYKNSRAKIDKKQLIKIKFLLKEGKLSHKEIGELFNVSRVFITKINCGYRYKEQGRI